jgi:hypothetical protein
MPRYEKEAENALYRAFRDALLGQGLTPAQWADEIRQSIRTPEGMAAYQRAAGAPVGGQSSPGGGEPAGGSPAGGAA